MISSGWKERGMHSLISYSSRSRIKTVKMERFVVAMALVVFHVSISCGGQIIMNVLQENITNDSTLNICIGRDHCGLNGICHSSKIGSIECSCPPGFLFVDDLDHSKGCFRSLAQQSWCEQSEMQDIDNIDWPGNDYESIPYISETLCKQACLMDCFCIVAVHGINGTGIPTCWKKAMPLMKGFTGANRASFVKISEPSKKKKRWVLVAIGSILLGCSFILATFSVIVYLRSRTFQSVAEATQKRTNVEGIEVKEPGAEATQKTSNAGIDVNDAGNIKTSNVTGVEVKDSGNVKDLKASKIHTVKAGKVFIGGVS